MRRQLPGCTRLGTAEQRSDSDDNLRRGLTEYPRNVLAHAAAIANVEAMHFVRESFSEEPIMGFTLNDHPFRHHRRYIVGNQAMRRSTDVFSSSGDMITNIEDCKCQFCRYIQSTQRFNEHADHGHATSDSVADSGNEESE